MRPFMPLVALTLLACGGDTADLQAQLDALAAEVADQEATDVSQEIRINGLEARVSALESRVGELEDALALVDAAVGAVEGVLPGDGLAAGGIITGDVVLDVPGTYATLDEALAWLSDKHIATDATVTVTLEDGTYDRTAPLVVTHPDGTRLFIEGNASTPSAVVLSFPADVSGIIVARGGALGGFNGLVVQGGGGVGANGLTVEHGAIATVGPDLTVRDFAEDGVRVAFASSLIAHGVISQGNKRGFVASRNAVLHADDLLAANNQREGVLVDWSSTVFSRDGRTMGNGDAGLTASAGGTASMIRFLSDANAEAGAKVERNGHAFVRAATLDGNAQGLLALASGTVDGGNAVVSQSTGDGVFAQTGAYVDVRNASVSGSVGFGVYAEAAALVEASGVSWSGNTGGDASPAVGSAPDGSVF